MKATRFLRRNTAMKSESRGINDVSTFGVGHGNAIRPAGKQPWLRTAGPHTLWHRSLAAEFMKSTTPTEGAEPRRVQTKVDDTTGEPMVFTEAGWESVAAAARRGRI
jgi:hypothetical protein